ncbi:hypothetical protein SAMN05192529_11441 [Arachidicoccus rhizosphaerae]|uniref:Purple acid phosphatase N-terminal domain-containing protein n=1 Tax=Arachidicoccus rhizosphaerae TaxID=551991 RepID=A0A1H4ACL4_9BACT|nr:hypothetical protein [Arachidicoccus rhizosphaerae]SEA33729.1 hypothetical protein SAMN05192529_11441 [Arachidicoccus rhizosphaerae]
MTGPTTICEVNVPLPVNLTYFTAAAQKDQSVLIQWGSASEQNVQGYLPETSTDAIHWGSLYTAPSQSASGNSSSDLKYSYIAQNVPAGIHYYRLFEMTKNSVKIL